jgi:putative heme-binding domain-containing protein
MDEKDEASQRPRYTWPRYVLGAVVVWLVLVIVWVSVIARRTREQRDDNPWPAPTPAQPVPKTNFVAPRTNSVLPNAKIDPVKTQRMAEFSDTLSGGNADAGRKVFFESPAASCAKCHKAAGQGGENGPALDGIGARQSREFILESILFPNAVINTNFQTVVVLLNNNTGVSGTLKSDTETNLVLITSEDGPVTVQKSDIQRRWLGASPMPEGIWQSLSKQELRDLIEFVATLKN